MKSLKFMLLLLIALPILFSCESTTESDTCATPTFSAPSGTYTSALNVTIDSETSDAVIKYTIDGTAPDTSATALTYSGAISVTSNMVIKAVAVKTGWNDSQIATATYVVYKDMVELPAGTFNMGRTVGTSTYADELPIHTVTLTRDFYIGKYEVTQAEWKAVMGATNNPSEFIGDNRPVEMVSWYHTLVYCNKRSIAEGLTPVYTINNSTDPDDWGTMPTSSTAANVAAWNGVSANLDANGYRLPTEAEWEFAARGGVTNPDYIYSGSDTVGEVAWYDGSSTNNVGTKAANGKGIFDMSGNVAEWVWDWYLDDYYNTSPGTDPLGPNTGTFRGHRGGSWFHDAIQVRVAYRDWGTPYDSETAKIKRSRLGFRVVRTAE